MSDPTLVEASLDYAADSSDSWPDGGQDRTGRLASMRLVQVQVFFRHGARTPVLKIGLDSTEKWSGVVAGKHEVGGGIIPASIASPDNIMVDFDDVGMTESWSGKKKKHKWLDADAKLKRGDLTTNGMGDALALGQRLRARYEDFLGGVTTADMTTVLEVNSTPVRRTIETAQGVATGVFGSVPADENKPQTVHIRLICDDAHGTGDNWLNLFATEKPKYMGRDEFRFYDLREGANVLACEYMSRAPESTKPSASNARALQQEVANILGWKVSEMVKDHRGLRDPNWSIFAFYDQLLYEIGHGKREDTPELRAFLRRLELHSIAHFKKQYGFDAQIRDMWLAAGVGETWRQSLRRFDQAMSGSRGPKLVFFSSHDTCMLPLMMSLIPSFSDSDEWTHFCCDLAVELWVDEKTQQGHSSYYVRALYRGKVVRHRLTTDDSGLCSLSVWRELLHPLTTEEKENWPKPWDLERKGCKVEPWKAALLGPFVDFTGLGAIIPILPFYVQDLGEHALWIGAILSAQYCAVVFGSSFWGRLSDYFGVRKLYLLLLVLDAILFATSALMQTVESQLIVRAAAGFCSPQPLAAAWISAACPPSKQMFAFTMLTVSVLMGFVIGSLIGGALGGVPSGIGVGDGGWFTTVMATAVNAAAVFLIVVLTTDSPPDMKAFIGKVESTGVKKAVLNIDFISASFAAFVGSQEGGFAIVVVAMLFIRESPDGYDYTAKDMSMINALICVALMFGSLVLEPIITSRTFPQYRLVLLALLVFCAYITITAIVYAWDVDGFWNGGDKLLVLLLIFGFTFQCLVQPTALTIGSIEARKGANIEGTVMGAQMTCSNIGQAIGPILAGVLFEINIVLPFLYLVAFEFLALVLNTVVYIRKRRSNGKDRITRSFCDFSLLSDSEERLARGLGEGDELRKQHKRQHQRQTRMQTTETQNNPVSADNSFSEYHSTNVMSKQFRLHHTGTRDFELNLGILKGIELGEVS